MSSLKNFWASNLKFLRHRLGLNQDGLAANLGITRSKLNAHENGKTVNPPIEDLIRFSEYFRFSIDSLIKVDLAGLSEPAIKELEAGNDTYAKGTRLRVLATTIDLNNRENIELVPARARAGYTAGYGDPEFISKLPVFSLPVLPKDRKYRAFPIQGDSMHPVPDGAHIIAEYLEDWLSLKQPTACIVVTRNEGIVFKMASLRPGSVKKLRLESLNWQYDPYEVSIEDVLEIWRFRSMLTDVLPEAETPAQQVNRMVQEVRADVKKLLKK